MKSTPSSVSTSRTADERGHHSAWSSVSGVSATKAVRLVRAVAERLVTRSAAAAERGSLAFVENGAVRVENPHAAGDEKRPVFGGLDLGRLLPPPRRAAKAARSQS